MRFTNKLCAQHLGWMFKKHWQVQGKRVPRDTGALAEMEKLGISVKDPQEVIKEKVAFESYKVVESKPQVILEDETHPNWHETMCHIYSNENVLLEGLPQAQLLTQTVEINDFPKNILDALNRIHLPSSVDKCVQNSIMAAHVFDAEQVKLPKIKVPERPTLNPPRIYGISSERRSRLLTNKIVSQCELLSGHSVNRRRKVCDNVKFTVTLPRNQDLLQFSIIAEKLIAADRPLEPIKGSFDDTIPDLYPIKCTITIPKKNVYSTDTFYPLGANFNCSHPHTIISHFDKEVVKHLHGSSVNTSQFQSRTLLKAFGVAAARARQIHGDVSLQKLDKPIVVQSIQTDGRVFHFGVFQLNTLSLGDSDGVKNYWFHQANMELFKECAYKDGRPRLDGYNKDVFRCLQSFYNNV